MRFSVTRRTVWAFVACASLAGCLATTADRRPQQAFGRPASRCWEHVRRSARVAVVGRVPGSHRDQHRVPADRLRRRDSGDHEPDGRLRRLRRAADAGSGHRVQGVPPDSLGAGWDVRDGQREDECTRPAEDHRPRSRGDLPRPDQELERPPDQEAEPGDHVPRPGRSLRSTAPTGPGRRTTSPTTSRPSAPRSRRKVGISTQPPFPVGVGGRGSSGVAGVVKSTQGGIGYADIAYAVTNHIPVMAVRNAAGKYTTPGIRSIAAASVASPRIGANNEMHIVNPPKSAPLAYPIARTPT